ncbi:acid protease [Epithele typhae]|uniref:acid protease n=1 Tax=Epithele typhae TaxID=378194 RepID=UPI0020074392|nr:acid protease [Epithele typhae]KAH9931105.1 acid protease [Epithele typhae]
MLSAIAVGLLAFAASETVATPQPQPIALQSRPTPKGHATGIRRRALSAIGVPLEDFFLGTDLQWFGNISVGTPPQDVSVVFDTGSSSLEFATDECTSCTQTGKFLRNRRGVDPVVNNDYVLTVKQATDSVTVGNITAKNLSFFTITKQTPKFNLDPFLGIQGMGSSAEGIFAFLVNQGLPSLFSMFLTPNAVGNAELLIGGIDNTKFKGNLVYTENTGSGDWEATASRISVNGKTSSVLNKRLNIVFDSGTSNILFSTSIANAMYALISPNIKPFAAEPGAYGIPCSQIGGLPAVIDLTFTDLNGTPFNLTIPSSELNVGPFDSDPSTCQTLINAFDGLDLVGGSVLKHYYSVWDIGNQRLGFAPNGF